MGLSSFNPHKAISSLPPGQTLRLRHGKELRPTWGKTGDSEKYPAVKQVPSFLHAYAHVCAHGHTHTQTPQQTKQGIVAGKEEAVEEPGKQDGKKRA